MPSSYSGPFRPAWSARARVVSAALTGTALTMSGVLVFNRGHALTEHPPFVALVLVPFALRDSVPARFITDNAMATVP